MAKTYANPEDHKYNVVQDMGKLREVSVELYDCLDRLKVSTGVPKSIVEDTKAKIQNVLDTALGKEGGPVRVNEDDLARTMSMFLEMAKGKRDHLLFHRLENGTIIEKFTNITIRVE